MDFHRLARRELQTLCKKNKIPANTTNVAMAEALKALEIVEGIEELLQPCESDTAQSSIESPVRSAVTTPYVPPTGSRSTRRRNVVKEETETANPMTRSRRTTQRTLVRDYDASQVDAIETPAAAVRTNRKKASMASACWKMDSQLKECVEEVKKNTIVTPAPLGVMSRRRAGKEESAVKRVYSTRRSARLAEKNATLLKEVENENPCPLKKDLFTKDHENVEMNSTGNSNDLDGISGIAGGDGNTNVEENSEKKDGGEVVSAQKQDISIVSEGEMVSTGEEEIGNHVEADGSKLEVKEGSDVEIQVVGVGCEDAAEFSEQKCDKMEDPRDENVVIPLNLHNEVQDSDGFHIMSLVGEGEMVSTGEDKIGNHVEADGSKLEVKEGSDVEIQEVGVGCEDAAEFSEQKCDKMEDPRDENVVMPLNLHNEVQDSDGFHIMSLVGEGEMVSTGEDKIGNHVEADGSKLEVKEGSDVQIQEVRFGCEAEAELDKQNCDKAEDPKDENVVTPLNVHNEVQESHGFHDMSLVSEGELVSIVEDEIGNHVEADGSKLEVKEGSEVDIQEVEFGCKTEEEFDEQKCEETEDSKEENVIMPLNVHHEVQEIGNHVEAEGCKLEVKEGSAVEIHEVGFGCENEAEFNEQKCDETEDSKDENVIMQLNVHNEVHESDVPHNVHTSEIKISVENKEEVDTEIDAEEYEVKSAEQKEIIKVVSAQKQDVLIINEGEMVNSGEEETGDHFEADVSKPEVNENSDVEIQDVGFGFETEANMDEQKCDKIEDSKDENIIMPISKGVQESNGIHDVKTSETEITVDQKEELNIDKDVEHDGQSAEFIENIVLESEVEEASCDTDIPNEIEKEMYNEKGNGMDSEHVVDFYVNEEVPEMKEVMRDTLILVDAALSEIAADVHVNGSEAELVTVEAKKESTDVIYQTVDDSLAERPSDVISLMNEEDEAKMKLNVSNWNAVIAELIKKMDPTGEKNEIKLVKDTVETHEIGFIQHEGSTKSADDVASDSKEESTGSIYQNTGDSDTDLVNEEDEANMLKLNITNWDAVIADLSDNRHPIGEKNEINLEKDVKEPHVRIFQHEESTKSADQVPSDTSGFLQTHPVQEKDLSLVVKPTSFTPIKSPASKASVTKKRMAAPVSDNKENIGSGSKQVIAKERVKTAKKAAENVQSLDHLSVRKLTMMLKEKLTITNNESTNGYENEQALARPALQALPHNR